MAQPANSSLENRACSTAIQTVSLYSSASVEVLPDQRWFLLDCLLSGTISDVLDRAVTALGGVETAAERLSRTTKRSKKAVGQAQTKMQQGNRAAEEMQWQLAAEQNG